MSRFIRGTFFGALAVGFVAPAVAQNAANRADAPAADPAYVASRTDRGASLTGRWTVTIRAERGDFDTTWDLVHHDDDSLTGEIEGRRGSARVEEGWVKGDAFEFAITREFQGQSFKITYAGTFTDAALEGTLTAGGGRFTAEFAGVRAGGDDR